MLYEKYTMSALSRGKTTKLSFWYDESVRNSVMAGVISSQTSIAFVDRRTGFCPAVEGCPQGESWLYPEGIDPKPYRFSFSTPSWTDWQIFDIRFKMIYQVMSSKVMNGQDFVN